MIPPSYRIRNVRSWSEPVVVPSDPRARAGRARCMIFSRKFTKYRARALRGNNAPGPFNQVYSNGPQHDTVRSLISDKSFFLTHCPEICVRQEISRPSFLDVSRSGLINSIDFIRRVFLRHVNISTRIFGDSVSCPVLYGGLYGRNLPHKFKKSYGDFQNRNFEKSHRTTGPRSNLRPDS
jgi:hypothetical protein